MAEIPKARERQQPRTPELSPATGAREASAAFAQAGAGLGGVAVELLERKRRLDTIDNNTWLLNATNDYQRRARELYTPMFTRKGVDTRRSLDESATFFKAINDEIAKNAPDDEYKNLALERISRMHNSYEDRLFVHQAKEVRQGNIDAISDMADEEAENAFTSGGTVEAIEAGVASITEAIQNFGADIGEAERDALVKEKTQHIANTAINRRMRIDPVGTEKDLEAGRYSKYITQEDREKHLKNARSETEWQDKQAAEAKADAQSEVVAGIVKDPKPANIDAALESPLFEGDAKATSTLVKIKNAIIKEQKQATKDAQYASAINDPELATKTDMEIRREVPDIADANRVIAYRDRVLKNPSVQGQSYNEVTKSFKADFKEGKFGKGTEGDAEYMRQLRDFQAWAIENPDKNPIEYYERIMAPINADFFDRLFGLGPSEIDPVVSRQREAWVRRAKEGNPDYTEDELRDYYDTNIKGKQ
jgi:hypothetical protein